MTLLNVTRNGSVVVVFPTTELLFTLFYKLRASWSLLVLVHCEPPDLRGLHLQRPGAMKIH